MWNRQREAQEARERLALIADEAGSPERDVDDVPVSPAPAELLAKADLIDP
jgi:ATP-binding cassette subfamily B protein